MNVLLEQLNELKLYGMAHVAVDLLGAKKAPSLPNSLQQLITAETLEREIRGIRYQMTAAKFPHHKDFATFDYQVSAIDETIIEPLCTGQFTEQAHNLNVSSAVRAATPSLIYH